MKSDGGFLLDVNVLIAMAWPQHTSHTAVSAWLRRHAGRGWATCALTELAFVRILANPAFTSDALSPKNALELLKRNLSHTAHQFWSCDLGYAEAVDSFLGFIIGHQQTTDAYLLGLAVSRKGKLVTLYRGIRSLMQQDEEAGRWIEHIGA